MPAVFHRSLTARLLLAAAAWMGLLALPVRAQTSVQIDSELAGIAGFRGLWDQPVLLASDGAIEFTDEQWKDKGGTAVWWGPAKAQRKLDPATPGAIAFDALQRRLLVRFPTAAEVIARELRAGATIEKAELVLPHRDTELWPPGDRDFPTPYGYTHRRNWGVDKLYRANPPRWHAVAHVLRRPWKADAVIGPTFNGHINGAGYWTKYGAADEHEDRFPQQFGPAEVSHERSDPIDVTPVLTDPAYGQELGQRLRLISDQGFVISKLETYDHRYFNGVYEWATATGGRGILLHEPRLVLHFKRGGGNGAAAALEVPPAIDVVALARELQASGSGGRPTAVLPTPDEIAAFTAATEAKPHWMPQWQYDRVQELRNAIPRLTGQPLWFSYISPPLLDHRLPKTTPDEKGAIVKLPVTLEDAYGGWVDTVIGRQPRGWSGFESGPEMTQWYLHGQYLPGPARDAIVAYWTAWLMPDRDTAPAGERMNHQSVSGLLVHPMADQLAGKQKGGTETYVVDTYWQRTGDWRGNKSFFRSGFNYTTSTQNFNTTASAGALLAGALIGSDKAIADGRAGFENYPMRMWAWGSGHSQELVDHYYMAVTLTGQKAVADFAPTRFDRHMGSNTLLKSIQEIACVWHPRLRRFISGSNRTSMEYLLAKQDGVNAVMHALSSGGALMDAGRTLPGGMTPIGTELPPNRVALQTMSGPWAPPWQQELIPDKPLPFRSRSLHGGSMQTSYLGQHFGLVSHDFAARRITNMAQWTRTPGVAERMEDLVTLDLRYGYNSTRFANDAAGWIGHPGVSAAVQHKGKLLAIASPNRAGGGNLQDAAGKSDIRSLQTSIALYNHQTPRTWQIFAGEQPVIELPHVVQQGETITIRDGEVFFAARPLDGTDLGRDALAVVREGDEQTWQNVRIAPALVLDCFNYRGGPLGSDVDWERIDRAFGGFALEIADAADYGGDFDAFRRHAAGWRIETKAEQSKATAAVKWQSAGDVLDLTANLAAGAGRPASEAIAAAAVNGQPVTLPQGLQRDTDVDQQGRGGRLEKNGAVLQHQPGKLAALMTHPAQRVYVGLAPVPELTRWSLATPGGIRIQADGQIGMTRVVVDETSRTIDVRSDFKPEQEADDSAASAVLVFGAGDDYRIMRDGAPMAGVTRLGVAGEEAMVVSLRSDGRVRPPAELEQRLVTAP
jgi:hypothetical protein